MALQDQVIKEKKRILKQWLDVLLESYPEDARRFFKKESDQFANPVGVTFSREMEGLLEDLIKGNLGEDAHRCLDRIIRIRAVQDFTPSEAVSFVFQLKGIIRHVMHKELSGGSYGEELRALEDNIDQAALLAFDIYAQCKHKIYELRVGEIRREVSGLLRRANLVSEIPQQ